MSSTMFKCLLLVSVLVAVAVTSSSAHDDTSPAGSSLLLGRAPHCRRCPNFFRPVCAVFRNREKTFKNACKAKCKHARIKCHKRCPCRN